MTALVRVCPVCDVENPPASPRCGCGASLVAVDFSLPRRASPAAATDRAVAVPGTSAAATDQAVAVPGTSSPATTPAPVEAPAPRPAGETSLDSAEPRTATSNAPAELRCPHTDCAQPNPPGSTRCAYCNRPLAPEASPTVDARPLPSALRDHYRVIEVFPATGSEADILLVEDLQSRERSVVKLYRKGIEPDFRLLEILAASAGASVVRVLDHGISDGVAYERLEYLPGGTLDAFLREGPLPSTDVREIVAQVAGALTHIHAHRILHRDLKPENVLLRSRHPLSLALSDFGIASLAAATQHFTSAARTTQYAAPEVLTGVIDEKADWWSLGMIALEAASGRHPFAGLTEQVMNHQLATRPVDVRVVHDESLRKLCRGLLLRDPRRRFGADEVARWLAGDPTLVAPEDTDTGMRVVKPYRIADAACTSAEELALALARHWDVARKDLARGTVARWVEQELCDYNLLRTLRDLQDDRALSDDMRVLRFIRAACPCVPPVWRGEPLDRAVLLAQARKAADGDAGATRWLDTLFREDVLAALPASADLGSVDAAWRAAWQTFADAWQLGTQLHAAARVEASRRPDTQGQHVDFDALAFGHLTGEPPPEAHDVHGNLVLAILDPRYAEALRSEVATERARIVDAGSWLDGFLERIGANAPALLAARRFLGLAAADAAADLKREQASERARTAELGEYREALRARVRAVLDLAPEDDDISDETAQALDAELARLQELCQRMLSLDLSSHAALRTAVEKLEVQAFGAQRALAELAHERAVTRIFTDPSRIAIPVLVVVFALITRNAWVIALALAAPAIFVGYRWYVRFQATDAVLAALRRFRLPARSFLNNEPGPAQAAPDDKKARGRTRAS